MRSSLLQSRTKKLLKARNRGGNSSDHDDHFAESGHPIFQAASPFGRGDLKSKGGGKKTIHYNGSEETVELILRTVISVNQLSIYVAVADLCEECNTCHDRTRRPVVAGQSNPLFVPSVMKTHTLFTDDPAQQEEDR